LAAFIMGDISYTDVPLTPESMDRSTSWIIMRPTSATCGESRGEGGGQRE
jgi:hypothetical protein